MATRKPTTGGGKSASQPAKGSKPKLVASTGIEAPTKPRATPDQVLRKKELYERVIAATGAKKRDVKLIVDAALETLGAALTAGEVLALPPLGKVRVNRQKDLASGELLIVKIRRGSSDGNAAKDAEDPLAEPAD